MAIKIFQQVNKILGTAEMYYCKLRDTFLFASQMLSDLAFSTRSRRRRLEGEEDHPAVIHLGNLELQFY